MKPRSAFVRGLLAAQLLLLPAAFAAAPAPADQTLSTTLGGVGSDLIGPLQPLEKGTDTLPGTGVSFGDGLLPSLAQNQAYLDEHAGRGLITNAHGDFLQALRNALDAADTALRGATVATHGGFVEKAREDLASAQAATNAASDFARANPAGLELPVNSWPSFEAELAKLGDALGYNGGLNSRSNLLRSQPNMAHALTGMREAFLVLYVAPRNDLGGAREKIITNLT